MKLIDPSFSLVQSVQKKRGLILLSVEIDNMKISILK